MEVDVDQCSRGESDKELEINIEFRSEVIPDEYRHENGSNGVVYIFSDNTGNQLADKLLDSLNVHGYNIPQENQYIITEDNDKIFSEIVQLADGDFADKTCLMVVLVGSTDTYKQLSLNTASTKIWSPFINNKELKYKPKIFMFFEYAEENPTTTDNISCKRLYDIPPEADVLIVHQKSEEISIKKGRLGFLMEFCLNLREYGERDDIIGLLTRSENTSRPLVISTLRKKFYVSSSSFREHYYDIHTNTEEMIKMLQSLNQRLLKLTSGSSRSGLKPSTAINYNARTNMRRSLSRTRNNMVTVDGNRSVPNVWNVGNREKKEVPKLVWKR